MDGILWFHRNGEKLLVWIMARQAHLDGFQCLSYGANLIELDEMVLLQFWAHPLAKRVCVGYE